MACLEFANVLARRSGDPLRHITSYHHLVSWSVQAGCIGPGDAQRLREAVGEHPEEADRATERARRLCVALRGIFSAVAEGRRTEPAELDLLNREWREVLRRQRIVARGARFAVELPPAGGSLVRPLWPVIRSAAELLVSARLDRVRICAAAGCTYLFLDPTRNGSRRWCDMRICGNRAKARRFQERHRGK